MFSVAYTLCFLFLFTKVFFQNSLHALKKFCVAKRVFIIADFYVVFWFSENFYESYGPVRRKIYNFCTSRYFELGVSAVIGINIVTMACEHYNQPEVG